MTTWAEITSRRAKLIHQEIAAWQSRASDLGLDPDLACAPFYKMLEEIYGDDLPLAKAKDDSDLLLHLEGKAVDESPRVSLVSNLFDNVKVQVRDLTKAIAGIVADRRISHHEIDLGLSGLAKGSLFVGFNVPFPTDRHSEQNFLGAQDPLYRATKDALRIINTVSHTVEMADEKGALSQVSQIVNDPRVRDAALVAVRRLAPSGKQGVTTVGVTSASENRSPARLTVETRSQLGRILRQPIISKETLIVEGIIREIDLDAKRFELRGITDHQMPDIRCIYSGVSNVNPRRLLDARVKVRGLVERRSDEAPRLLAAESIEIVGAPNEPQLI